MTASLDQQLARLTTLSSGELRAEWLRLYKVPAPAMTADLLRRGVAHKLQERALGGLQPATRREVERLCRTYQRTGEVAPSSGQQIKLGTRLVRDWGGRSHHVLVVEGGFLYREQRYRSLSTIATEITGTRWSGPRFFGTAKAKADA